MSLYDTYTFTTPLTTDGLIDIQTDTFSFSGPDGVLQNENGTVSSSMDVLCGNIQPISSNTLNVYGNINLPIGYNFTIGNVSVDVSKWEESNNLLFPINWATTTVGLGTDTPNTSYKLDVMGNAQISNLNSNVITANLLGGILTTSNQSNITNVGTLGVLAVTGNVIAGNISTNSIVGTITTPTQAQITQLGTLTSLNVSGNSTMSNLLSISANVTSIQCERFEEIGNVLGETFIRIRNTSNSNVATSVLRMNNDLPGSHVVMFLNSSTRVAENGPNSATIRNNIGNLHLQSQGATGITIEKTTGNVTCTNNLIATNMYSSTGSFTGNVISGNVSAFTGTFTTLVTSSNITAPNFVTVGNVTCGNLITSTLPIVNNVRLNTDLIPQGISNLYSQFTTEPSNIVGSKDLKLSTNGKRYLIFDNQTFLTPSSNNVGITFRDSTTPLFSSVISGSNQTWYFQTAGIERMKIDNVVNFSTAPFVNGTQINTNEVLEGTNLYYTDSRARASISALSPLSYNNSSGVLSLSTNNQANEWKYSAPTTVANNRHYFIARMLTNSNSDCGLSIKGIIGGYVNNEISKIDIAINTRGGYYVYGSLETNNSTLAAVIALADISIYSQTIGGSTVYDIYIVGKSGRFFSYDLIVNGSELGVALQNPTTTPITPTGTLTLASVLSNVRTYTISGHVGIGRTNPEAPLSFADTTGRKIDLYSTTYSIGVEPSELRYATNGIHAWRTGGYSGTEVMRILANGNMGVGKTNPDTRLDINGRLQISNPSNIDGGDAVLNFKCNNNTLGYLYLDQQTSKFILTRGIDVSGDITTTTLIGVGTTAPTNGLQVYKNTSASAQNSIVSQNNTNWALLWSDCALITNNTNTNGIRFGTATSTVAAGWVERMRLTTSGNLGIGTSTPLADLHVQDNTPVAKAETTINYDNSIQLIRAAGKSYNINEIISGGFNFKTVGAVPVVNFSNVGTDGSAYVDCNSGAGGKIVLGVNQLTTAYGALFSNPSWIMDLNIYIKDLDIGLDNVIFDCPSGQIGINTSGQLYFLTKWSTFTTRLTWTATNLKVDEWTRITIYFVNATRLTFAIVNGVNYGSIAGYDNSTISSDNVSIGGITSKFLFYMNTIRMVYSGDFTVNTLPLAPRASGNVFLMRILESDNIISLNRAGYLSGLSNYKSYQLLRIDSVSGTNDGYRINSASFTKRSLNERLVLHYRYSAYASAAGIHTTWFYIHEGGTNTYTNGADFAKNQWTVGGFGQRLYTTGTLFLPDGLPVGNYYIIFNNPAQLRCDGNDEIRLYLTTTQV